MTATASDPAGTHDWYSVDYVDGWVSADRSRGDQRDADLRMLVDLLPFGRDARVSVLDIGAGYGRVSRLVVDRLVNSEVVLHDFSLPMFEHARSNLADVSSRIQYVSGDLRDPGWTASLPGTFDAVVSAIAIHNVRDVGRIRALYGEIGELVRPGGCFLNLDIVVPVRARHVASSREVRMPEATLFDHLSWLAESGFDEVDCFRRHERNALLGAFKVS